MTMTIPPPEAKNEPENVVDTAAEPSGIHEVRSKAIKGVKSLGLRTIGSVVLRAVSSVSLGRLLFPKDYGLFGVAASVAGLGQQLSDVGLGYVLVWQERTPDEDETATVFWSQQVLCSIVVLGTLALLPLLLKLYNLDWSAASLVVAMTMGLYLSSLRVIPMMALERSMRFGDIARVELIENVVQVAATIGMAAAGLGPWSLAAGGLVGRGIGLGLVWAASPWRPRGRFRWNIFLRLAKMGIPMQLVAMLPTIMGSYLPLYVSRYLGTASLGLVNWAINLALVPTMLGAMLNRVAFPSYSRLQSDPEEMGRVAVATLRRINMFFGILMPVIVIVSPLLIPLIFGRKWTEAVPVFQWASMEMILGTSIGLLGTTQSSAGRPQDRLWVVLATGALRWGVGYFVIKQFGLPAVGALLYGMSLVELVLNVALVRRAVRGCERIVGDVLVPTLALAAITGLALWLASVMLSGGPQIGRALVALAIYALLATGYDLAVKHRPVTTEMRGLLRMMRASGARA